MSLTVGLPTAMGADLLLHGKISEKGVIRPIYKDIYDPILKMLEKVNIKLIEVEEEL
jgi:saccharopine dehydrogenase-like NADP-dependent oxidoreductase